MLFVIARPARARRRSRSPSPSNRRRPLVLLAGALLHAAGVAAPARVAAAGPAGRLARARPARRRWRSSRRPRSSSPAPSTRRATCARRDDRDNRVFVRRAARAPRRDDRRRRSRSTSASVGRDRGDDARDARRSSTSTTTPARSRRPGSTCSSARSASRSRCSGRSSSRSPAPRPAGPRSLLLDDLVAGRAAAVARRGCAPAFVFLLVGYGTKMGLAPLHTWKPDAYGEAPGLLGALLAGGLTNCAFLAHRARVPGDCRAAGEEAFARDALVGLGLLSIARRRGVHGRAARLQADARVLERRAHGDPRPRASASAAPAAAGAFFHSMNNGLTKGVLFLSAGNIHRAFGSQARPTTCAAPRAGCRSPARSSSPGSSPSPARRRSRRSSASSRS